MKSSKNLGQVANKMFRALEHLPDAKENTPGSGKQQAPSAGIARAAGPQLLQRPTVSIIATATFWSAARWPGICRGAASRSCAGR